LQVEAALMLLLRLALLRMMPMLLVVLVLVWLAALPRALVARLMLQSAL